MKYNEEKHHECDCEQCKAIAEGATPEEAAARYKEWEAAKMAEYGWVVHFVKDEDSPTGLNIHTHGLQESFDHPDLQVVLPIPTNIIQPILHTIVDRIKAGERFSDGETIENVISNGLSVKMVNAKESDREVLRVIFPDQLGNCDSWSMKDPYLRQYGDLVDLPPLPEKFKPRKRSKWTPFKGDDE